MQVEAWAARCMDLWTFPHPKPSSWAAGIEAEEDIFGNLRTPGSIKGPFIPG